MNAHQTVRESTAQAAMEVIVGKTDVPTQEILDCWAEDKHHLAALPLYPMFASLDFDALTRQHEWVYQMLLRLAVKIQAAGPLLYFVVLPLDRDTAQVTTLPQPDDMILFQTESEAEAETWRRENCEKVVVNQPAGSLLTQDQLAALVPSKFRGKTISPQTIRRWQLQGLHGIFLNYTRVGSIPCSTENDLKAFFDELTKRDQAARLVPDKEVNKGKSEDRA